MPFKMKIETSNAAFAPDEEEDEPGDLSAAAESCAQILRDVVHKLEEGYTSGPLYDYNGNAVGSFSLTLDT